MSENGVQLSQNMSDFLKGDVMIVDFDGKSPVIDGKAFVAENCSVIGDVAIGPESSVWFGAVIRGRQEQDIYWRAVERAGQLRDTF